MHDLSTREKGRRETYAGWEVVRGKYHAMRERRMYRAGTGARSPNQRPHRQQRSRPRPWPWVPPPNQCDCNQPKSQRAGNRAGKHGICKMHVKNHKQHHRQQHKQQGGGARGRKTPHRLLPGGQAGNEGLYVEGQRPPQNPNGSTSGTRARS